MPSSRSKRKNDKKAKSNKCPKVKRPAESQELEMRPFTDGCDVVSSILEEGRKDDDKLDDDIASIASDTLLCLEEVYCDTHSTSQSPIDSWVRNQVISKVMPNLSYNAFSEKIPEYALRKISK